MLTKLFPTRRGEMTTFENLREEMDRRFNDWVGAMMEPPFRMERPSPALFTPRMDVVETDKELRVVAELPGMDEKHVEVEMTRNALVIRGEKAEEKEEKAESYYWQERRFGSFLREIPLPYEMDETLEPQATFKNGVLTVIVPKPKEATSLKRKIEVRTV